MSDKSHEEDQDKQAKHKDTIGAKRTPSTSLTRNTYLGSEVVSPDPSQHPEGQNTKE